ncbi:MAG: hypothetical protein Q8P37_01600 [Candidatus Spechtbacteria bacterium]|nr:hypothetical protein [Candidatus Spechtbacteria bacterium]
MNLFKIIFATALAIILVVSTLVALFGVGKAVNATLRTYILQVEECRYQPRILAPEKEGDIEKVIDQEECSPDYNRAKQDVAEGAGMFIVSAPLAWFMYRQTRRMMEDSK